MSRRGSTRAAKKVQDLGKILLKEELSAKYRQVSPKLLLEFKFFDCLDNNNTVLSLILMSGRDQY